MISELKLKRYCKDEITKIENYEQAINDKTQVWDCHHRLELTLDGDFANSREDLKRLGMYYNRPYFELILLPHREHIRLHGKALAPETLEKMSSAKKGMKFTEEHRAKMSKAHKGMKFTEEHRAKMSESRRKYLAKRAANKE